MGEEGDLVLEINININIVVNIRSGRRETRGKRPRPPPSRLIEFVCTRVKIKIKINDYSTMLRPAIPPSSALRHLGYNPGPAFAEGSPPEVYLLPQPDKKIALGCLSNTSSP